MFTAKVYKWCFRATSEKRPGDEAGFRAIKSPPPWKKRDPGNEVEPAVFVPEVAKQHDVSSGAIASGVLVSARASL